MGVFIVQVGNFMHYISRFIAGFTIGFIRLWQISLVTLSIVPLIAVAGGAYAFVATGLISKVRKSYVRAGEIAQEVYFFSLLLSVEPQSSEINDLHIAPLRSSAMSEQCKPLLEKRRL